MQFHHHRRQRREAATETDRKQQPVLVGNDARFVEPGRRRDEVRDGTDPNDDTSYAGADGGGLSIFVIYQVLQQNP